jgi:D-glycero-D-manno-heptose 1,7-bisphosphate phosphatase
VAQALFLDRDGVINADSRDFIKTVAEWVPLPGSLGAIARLCDAGFCIVVITNQSGIARGLFDEATLAEIHEHMSRQIEEAGGKLSGIYHCPHAPNEGCGCRKPKTGLIERACVELGIESSNAPMIGDRMTDLLAARASGCRPILLRSGFEISREVENPEWRDVKIYRDLADAANALLAESR